MKSIFLLLALPPVAFADSKTEADLRARLAASEAARVASDVARAEAAKNAAAIGKLAQATAATAAATKATATAANQVTASNTADANAQNAQNTADVNGIMARQQAKEALDVARSQIELARVQAEQSRHDADKSLWALYTLIVTTIGSIAIALINMKQGQSAIKQAQETAKLQTGKMDQIHTLVNSKMTESMENELAALQSSLASLQEIVNLRRAAQGEPTAGALAIIESTKEKVAELTAQLVDRSKATEDSTKKLNEDRR